MEKYSYTQSIIVVETVKTNSRNTAAVNCGCYGIQSKFNVCDFACLTMMCLSYSDHYSYDMYLNLEGILINGKIVHIVQKNKQTKSVSA